MTDQSDLLPGSSSPFEKALAKGFSDNLPVPIRDIVNPAITSDDFLPFLASHESVDLWFEDWTEERKREMVGEAMLFARLKGTRAGTLRALDYVDAVLLNIISHPTRFVLDRSRLARTPIGHKPFVARHLVKVETKTPAGGFVLGRGVLGRHKLKGGDMTKFKRVFIALRVAKSPAAQYRVDFGHKRPLAMDDLPAMDDGHFAGEYVNRVRL